MLYFDGGDRIAADVGKTVAVCMVIAALEQKAVRKMIADLEVNAHGRHGIGEDLFAESLKMVLWHKFEFKA